MNVKHVLLVVLVAALAFVILSAVGAPEIGAIAALVIVILGLLA